MKEGTVPVPLTVPVPIASMMYCLFRNYPIFWGAKEGVKNPVNVHFF